MLSSRDGDTKIQEHEIESILILANKLMEYGVAIKDLDGFYIDYQIAHISKQFDLIKVTEESATSIELKSKMTDEEKIKRQLQHNKYYIDAIQREGFFFTVVIEPFQVFQLVENELKSIGLEDIVICLQKISNQPIEDNLDTLFKPSNYLVSPINNPERFARGEYFLTNQQHEIKDKILKLFLTENGFLGVTGKAGTGKTLLLFDIAKELGKTVKVLVIHCAKLAPGHSKISKLLNNVSVVHIKDAATLIDQNDVILIDESQRLHSSQLKSLVDQCRSKNKMCLFFYDSEQILSNGEKNDDSATALESICGIQCFGLSDKIRTNYELSKIIPSIFNLNKKVQIDHVSNFEVMFAKNVAETNKLVGYYHDSGYTFINFSKSNYNYSNYSQFLAEDFDTHHVIGQEFDNVVVVLGREFSYMETRELKALPHPTPDYLYVQLLYQALTRARFKIAIIVCDNYDLYHNLMTIIA